MPRNELIVKQNLPIPSTSGVPIPAESIPLEAEWFVCDVSGSMGLQIAGSQTRRIDALNEAIATIDDRVQLLAFEDKARLAPRGSLLKHGGGTNFVHALETLVPFQPSYILILSDGEDQSHSENTVLSLAETLSASAIIETLYIGADNDSAEKLMRRLAEIGHGRFRKWDSTKPQQLSLTSVIQGFLPWAEDGSNASKGVIKL